MSGSDESQSTTWPHAYISGSTQVAASADAIANHFSLMLTFLCIFHHVFNGNAIDPCLHMLPIAATPVALILGILARALPVPYDSAEYLNPASGLTPWAYLWLFYNLLNTELTKSYHKDDVNTGGSFIYDLIDYS